MRNTVMFWVNVRVRMGWSDYTKKNAGAGDAHFLLAEGKRRSLGSEIICKDWFELGVMAFGQGIKKAPA